MPVKFPFKCLPTIVFAIVMTWHVPAMADLYRYENENGDVILTTEPRKGLKLLEVIRDSKPTAKPAKTSDKDARNTRSKPAKDMSKAYDAFIAEAAQIYGIPVPFIKAVIKIESNFNPRAVSRVGAMGLMQLMPATAEHMKVADPFDPRQNILGGTKYLRRLSDRYDGDINLILSGYHAGPGNVEKAGGIPFEKTQQYVKNVYSWYVRYRNEMQMPYPPCLPLNVNPQVFHSIIQSVWHFQRHHSNNMLWGNAHQMAVRP